MIYWDTSALVKLFVQEVGTDIVKGLIRKDPNVVISKIAFPEAHSAYARRKREQILSERDYRKTVHRWNRFWKSCLIIELSDEILSVTETLIKNYPLRGFDAIHLASAIFFRDSIDSSLKFACSDKRLLEVAEKERFSVISPL